jgi:hypothetical protein
VCLCGFRGKLPSKPICACEISSFVPYHGLMITDSNTILECGMMNVAIDVIQFVSFLKEQYNWLISERTYGYGIHFQ